MNIIRQLTEKPWVTSHGSVEDLHDEGVSYHPASRLGLRMFLAVVTVLFMLLIIAYGNRMLFEDWRPGPDLRLLWYNTFMLILSSAAMQWATYSAYRRQMEKVKTGLLAGGLFTSMFLGGQFLAWNQLHTLGFFDVTNPAIAFFYLITGLHALHIMGGLVAWGKTTEKVWRRDIDAIQIRQSIELCTTYWHYLLGVWLVLFGLLFSGNNLDTLLAICGLK